MAFGIKELCERFDW